MNDVIRKVIVVGAGGHARVLVSILGQMRGIELVGVADRTDKTLGEIIGSTKVTTTFAELPTLLSMGVRWAALAIGDNRERADLFEKMKAWGFSIANAVHPMAIVEPDVRIGEGVVICPGAILCAGVTLDSDVLINTGAIVEHECKIGSHVHIGPGCRVAGRVKIGEGTFLGIGSTVSDRVKKPRTKPITIGAWCVIGAGSVVVDHIPPRVVAYGVPARMQRHV